MKLQVILKALLCLPLFCFSLCGDVLTVDMILKHTAYESPDMISARIAIAQNNADRYRGWATYLPLVTMGYQVGGYHEMRPSINPSDATRFGGNYSLTATHPLYNWGAIGAERKLGFIQESISEKEGILTFSKLIRSVRSEYYGMIVRKQRITVIQKKIEEKKRWLEMNRILTQNEQKSKIEFASIELDLKGHDLSLTYEMNQLERSLVAFRNNTGFLKLEIDQIPTSIDMPDINLDSLNQQYNEYINGKFDKVLPSIISSERLKGIDNQLILVGSSEKPNLNVSVGVTQGPMQVNNKYEFATTFFTGVSGSWALFDRKVTSTNLRSLLLQKRQVDTQQNVSRLNSYNEGKNLLELIKAAKVTYDLRLTHLELAKKHLELAESAFKRGDSDQSRVSGAQFGLLDNESAFLAEKSNLLNLYYSFLGLLFSDTALDYFDPKDQRL